MGLFSWAKRPTNKSRADEALTSNSEAAAQREREGIALIAAGQFEQARDAFQGAIALRPGIASNHVNLAYALQQCDAVAEADMHLYRAIELDAGSFDAHYMLALSLEQSHDFDSAARHLKIATALKAEFEPVHADLCRVLSAAGELEASGDAIQAAILRFPDNPEFHLYLGNVRMKEGRQLDAVVHYDRAIGIQPHLTAAHVNRALALQDLERFDDAVESFICAIELDSRAAETHAKLAMAYKSGRRLAEARGAIGQAIDLQPDNAELHNDAGVILHESGLVDEAIASYEKAIALRPDLPGAYANLGSALQEKGDWDAAIVACRKSLSIFPVAEAHNQYAMALSRVGAVAEAIVEFGFALALEPDHASARSNMASALTDAGRQKEAIAVYRAMLRDEPDLKTAYSNLLFYLSVDESTTPAEYLEAARSYDRAMTPLAREGPRVSPLNGRKLKVGFVSGDLNSHPVGYFTEGMLKHLDTDRLELFGYPTNNKEDDLSRRIRPYFKSWRSLRTMNDEEALQSIRADQLDILIDLSGHTGGGRLGVFALRAAPIQVAWLGFFASTGLSAMDYILADEACVPLGNEYQFSERVWRLPDTRLCFTPPPSGVQAPVQPSPAVANGFVTFGCFQRWAKIHPQVLALWARVLAAVPDAKLLLQSLHGRWSEQVEDMFLRLESAGIARSRVQIRGSVKRDEYLRSYGDVDIVLDTFPFTGGTTTCEALWMGVPTLTLMGDSMISLQGVAIMRAAGMPEWIARDADDFVSRASSFASDVLNLAATRSAMRPKVEASVLFDTALFARRFEEALFAIQKEGEGAMSTSGTMLQTVPDLVA